PACTLVSHHELVPYWLPRLNVSLTKPITSKLKLVSGEPWNRYDTTLFWPLLPVHTCQLRPAMLAVPTGEPIGWMVPEAVLRLSQIMISVSWTPVVLLSALIQMS